jgi:hypothetical protein
LSLVLKTFNQRKWTWLNKESISGGAIKEKGPKQDVVEKWEVVLENSFKNGKILSFKKELRKSFFAFAFHEKKRKHVPGSIRHGKKHQEIANNQCFN